MTGPFVLDASMTVGWAFEDESTPFTLGVLKSLETVHAVAPALWPLEVANVLSAAERRGRIDTTAQVEFLERLRLLPIQIERRPAVWLAQQILPLARTYGLSAYDAAYLELAVREGLPLAALDDEQHRAASAAGAALVVATGTAPASSALPGWATLPARRPHQSGGHSAPPR